MPGRYKSADVSFLANSLVQQLALGLYEFQFHFDTGATVSVRHKLIVENIGADPLEINAENPAQTKDLYFLLGCKIKDAQIDNKEILSLIFDNQSKIIIRPSDNGYESYVISHKGNIIAV